MTQRTATVERLTIYPIKSLDGRPVDSADIAPNGGLVGDREYALFDAEENYVNGKREQRVHPIRADYTGTTTRAESVTLSRPDGESATFELGSDGVSAAADSADSDTEVMATWLTDWFEYPVRLQQDTAGGFPDDTTASGPTIISTATIEAVASWFDGISVNGMRRRLRANVEVGGVPAFWEDNLFADRDHRVRFSIGGTPFVGVNPCQRCVVPTRNPDTGEEHAGFQSTFVEQRRKTMPQWSGGDWFDHDFRLMVNTAVPEASWGETLSVGDSVVVGERFAADDAYVGVDDG